MTTTNATTTPVTEGQGAQAFRLSFAQERIWFLEQLDPGTPVFTISTALRAVGPLDVAALRSAFDALTARHEVLRTRFVTRDGSPIQEVLPHCATALEIVDWRDKQLDDAALQDLIRRQLRVVFDLTEAPLMRAWLIRRTDTESVLVVNLHHIICDGPSAEIMWRDLTELYQASGGSRAARLPDLPVQYADFAEWQRDTVDEAVMAEQLDFWRAELHGTSGHCELVLDRPRPPAQDTDGGQLVQLVPAARARRLLEVAREEQVSPFMLVLAAYEVALSRMTGRTDFCVGTSIAGRTRREVEDILGCFLNLMPLRSDTAGDPPLRELLRRVRQRCLRAYANADLPFERLVNDIAPDRDLSRPPLFDVLLAVQNSRSTGVRIGELSLTPEDFATATARYDLALDVEFDDGGMTLGLSYATSLFDPPSAQLVLDRVAAALAAFEGDLDRCASLVTLPSREPTPPGRWSGSSRLDWLGEHCLTAVRGAAEPIWAAVEATAGHLAAAAAGDPLVVAVAMAPGIGRLAATLGALRAGAAVLLQDPGDPQPWQQRQRAAVGAAAVLSDSQYQVDGQVAHWAGGLLPAPAPILDPRAPALVAPLLTVEGGSDGGVARTISAGALTSVARSLAETWQLGPGETLSVAADLDPTLSLVVALAGLSAGATIVTLPPVDESRRLPSGRLCLPMDTWRTLSEAGWAPAVSQLAILPQSPDSELADWLRRAGARVSVTLCPSDWGVPYAAGEVGAARPLHNLGIELRDELGAPALTGAVGELLLTGPVFAGGDADRPAVDLARSLDGGAPTVVGRRDGTPVTGGRSIDPAPALTAMLGADGVTDAVVVPSATGHTVAYVTSAATAVPALVQMLRRELPRHLVPDRIVAVSGAPRRPDGSFDPAALSRPGDEVAAQRDGAPAGPRDHVERALLECFANGLDRSDLGIHDDFFASGGTSLSAARLVGALSDAVGAPVPLKMLFQHPSVGELSAALASEGVRAGQRTALEAATEDQSLPADIVPSGPRRIARASTVFLTGATGFVGSHLLAQLLASGLERVGCLVRGPDDASCAQRLRDRVEMYGQDVDWDRVDVVRGDLCDPLLGLEPARFQEIADGADLIYHLGAHMNFLRPYRVLHGPNVHGTLEIVRLACTGRPSVLHYVSTIDSQAGDHLQERRVPVSTGRNDGYVLTKKTAEQLVLQAGERGLPIGIYRPWQITSHTRTGAVNPQDQLALCLTGILLTGVAPSDNPLPLRMLPVDVVNKVLVEMADRVDAASPVHHFYNPRVTPIEVVCDVVREAGYPVRLVPYQRWRLEVVRRTAGRVDGLAALLAEDASQATLPSQVDTDNLVRHLGYAPDWPAADREWVRRTIEFLVATGVAAPAHRVTGAETVRT